jgi:MoaA/NifB/PqqE/SkfB family radical SAM enzyme
MEDNTCLFTLEDHIKGAVWEITYRCGYGCVHCCNKSVDSDELKRDELSTEELKRGIDHLVDFGINSIYISGGDPLEREDFLCLLTHTKSRLKNKNLFFATNGKKLTPDIAKEIGNIDIGSVLISLDGHTPQIAEKFRPVKDNYYLALRAVDMLKQNGVQVTIGSVLWKETYGHIEDLIKIGVNAGADTIFFSWLVDLGRAEGNKEITVPEDYYFQVADRLHALRAEYAGKINVRFRRFETITEKSKSCPGGINNYHLVPSGRVSVCSWAYKLDSTLLSQESIKDKPFTELVNDEPISGFREMIQEREKMGLGPGCPVLCKIKSGDYLTEDPLFRRTIEDCGSQR